MYLSLAMREASLIAIVRWQKDLPSPLLRSVETCHQSPSWLSPIFPPLHSVQVLIGISAVTFNMREIPPSGLCLICSRNLGASHEIPNDAILAVSKSTRIDFPFAVSSSFDKLTEIGI